MLYDHLDILGYDEDLKTIFAKITSGSISLDVIPLALGHLNTSDKFDNFYFQDYTGTEFVISKGSSIEQGIQAWQDAKNGVAGPLVETKQTAQIQQIPAGFTF